MIFFFFFFVFKSAIWILKKCNINNNNNNENSDNQHLYSAFCQRIQCAAAYYYGIRKIITVISIHVRVLLLRCSGVARAFLGRRLAHPKGQNEEENK